MKTDVSGLWWLELHPSLGGMGFDGEESRHLQAPGPFLHLGSGTSLTISPGPYVIAVITISNLHPLCVVVSINWKHCFEEKCI